MELKLLTDKDGNFHIGRSKAALEKFGSQGALFIGKVEEEGHSGRKVLLDSLFPHVIFVCGARGSGKSYTVGVIAEELLEKNAAVAAVLIDPVGVFWSMRRPNSEEKEKENLREWGLLPKGFSGRVRVLVPEGAARKAPKETYDGTFSLRASELTMDDWCLTFGLDRFDPASLALERVIVRAGPRHTIDQLIHLLGSDQEITSKDTGFSKQTRRGIISRLESAKEWGLLSDEGTKMEEIARIGELTVLDVSFLEESVACLVVGIVARKLLEARKAAARSEAIGYRAGKIPPTWLLIDEAHSMVPNVGRTAASESIVEYVKQGRRPGCSIVLATQQPSAIDSRVLSQLDILVCHKLVFYDDVKSVFRRFPSSVDREMEDISFVRTIPMGVALVGDREESSSRAFVARIRPRMSQHEGRSRGVTPGKADGMRPLPEAGPAAPGEREILCAPSAISSEQAFKTAEGNLRKFLMLIPAEQVVSRKLAYYPLWQVSADLPASRRAITIQLDGITGEIASPVASGGLLDLLDMPAAKRSVLLLLNSEKTLSRISKEAGLDEKSAKRQLDKLLEEGMISASPGKKGVETLYKSRQAHALPEPEELNPRPAAQFEKQPVEGAVIGPEIGYADIEKILSLFGKTVRLRDARVVYRPYWLFRTSKGKRIIAVDATQGRIDEAVGRLLVGRA